MSKIFVFSGASGVGKSTVLGRVMAARGDLKFSVSATTRAPRENKKTGMMEVDGVDYFFVTRERFEEMIRRGEMLEYDEHFGNLYGTPVNQMAQDSNIVLDVEPNGALNIKKNYPDAVLIFVVPPSIEELERRLRSRGDTPEDQIPERLSRAAWEMEQSVHYDHTVVNDDLERCVAELLDIISAEADT